jgi:hypothetical protein
MRGQSTSKSRARRQQQSRERLVAKLFPAEVRERRAAKQYHTSRNFMAEEVELAEARHERKMEAGHSQGRNSQSRD